MDSKKHTEFTGSKAKISGEVGGKIMAYDGYILGENVELVKNKRIVQKWRGDDWPKGHYSVATFDLEEIDEGTKLIFTQTKVPEQEFAMVSQGWYEFYWDPMRKKLEE
jgi:activator of HSP90 ATPase